jgi:hypothetical protein
MGEMVRLKCSQERWHSPLESTMWTQEPYEGSDVT